MDEKLRKIISNLKNIPEEKWDIYILQQDMFYRYYTEEMSRDIIREAKEWGRKKADEILNTGANINELIKVYNLEVMNAEDNEFIMPDSINFAEYHDKKIRISKRLLKVLEENKEILHDELGKFDPWNVLFFHELYHYYEDVEENFENAGLRLVIQPIPLVKKKISPESAGEIAAYEFARQMQKIEFHPYILGIIGVYEQKREVAEKIIDSVMG